jgi:hypothetical protein
LSPDLPIGERESPESEGGRTNEKDDEDDERRWNETSTVPDEYGSRQVRFQTWTVPDKYGS